MHIQVLKQKGIKVYNSLKEFLCPIQVLKQKGIKVYNSLKESLCPIRSTLMFYYCTAESL